MNRSKALHAVCKRAPAIGLPDAAAFSRIAVGFAANTAGAHSQRPQSTVHLLDFLLCQITRTLAEQHSVLVVHIFLLSSLGSVERSQTRQETSGPPLKAARKR
jgi:hypothetical protein